jgi:peroxiredoxin
MRPDDLYSLPPNLPVPIDDGACMQLEGAAIPPIKFRSTSGGTVDLSALAGRVVVYVYPKTGSPDRDLPVGWNDIPGARGCTPQSCRFRDLHEEFEAVGVKLFGMSTQSTPYQREVAQRLHLPFPLLSDDQLELTHGWGLPTFTVEGEVLLKRMTFVLRDGHVEKVFYPIFPPTTNADDVLAWLKKQGTPRSHGSPA